jgi:uncharacterized membrane protein
MSSVSRISSFNVHGNVSQDNSAKCFFKTVDAIIHVCNFTFIGLGVFLAVDSYSSATHRTEKIILSASFILSPILGVYLPICKRT